MGTKGSGSGKVSIESVTGTYNFILPATVGTANYLLTSDAGAGAMTWTNPASIVPAQVTVTQQTSNSTFYPTFISGDTTGSYGIDVGTALSYVPSSGLLSCTAFLASSQIQTPNLLITTGINFIGSSSGDVTIQAQAAAGTYNFNLPITAGTATYLLTSDGGGAGGGMTWTNPATFAPAFSGLNTDGVVYATSSSAVASTAAGTNHYPLVSNGGSGSAPTFQQLGLTTGVTGTLPVGNGGTGQASALNQYGVVCASTTTAMVSTSAGTANYPLVANNAAVPTFQQLGLTTGVTGVLPIANGGTDNGSLAVTAGGTLYTDGTKIVNVGAGTAGQFLQSNGSSAPQWGGVIAANTSPTVQTFTSGSGTYTLPAGCQWISIKMIAGGGGGAGSSTAAASNGGTGGTGGNTTFGTSLLTANGGVGGTGNNSTTPGTGGTASISSPAIGTAVQGGYGFTTSTASLSGTAQYQGGGGGGISPFGGAGAGGSIAGSGAGFAAIANSGSGGGGGCSANEVVGSNTAAGSGGGAGGFISATVPSPSASYSWAVGGSGSAGSAGTGGNAGGAGGSGYIEVTEYYTATAIGTTTSVSANNVLAGPTSGSAATPSFRALVAADLPAGVNLQYNSNGGTSITASTTNVDFTSKIYDSNNAFTSNTTFTAPYTGVYQITGAVDITARTGMFIFAWVNGSQTYLLGGQNPASGGVTVFPFCGQLKFTAGDTLNIRTDTNVTLNNQTYNHWISIALLR